MRPNPPDLLRGFVLTCRMFERDGAKVVADAISLELITGSKIDYTRELIGSQFKIVDNPAASSNCGYSSFTPPEFGEF
jgi:Fe-S cluster assembly iron-binding protein IscA